MKTLIIIDMQSDFVSLLGHADNPSAKELIENINDLCKRFVARQQPIILVEFVGFGNTVQPIASTARRGLVARSRKYRNDGSLGITRILQNREWSRDLVVTGIFGDECVYETVNGLVKLGISSIQIPKGCVSPAYPEPMSHKILDCSQPISAVI